MRVLLQRVKSGEVQVGGERVGAIDRGLVLLVGINHSDAQAQADYLADKVANLRIFEDAGGKMNRSPLDVSGGALVVSQFTLYANTQRGRRPSFVDAASSEVAEPLVEYFAQQLESRGISVQRGRFGAHMQVQLLNDGPVTIMLERD